MVREYFFSTDMSSLFHVMLAFVVFSTGQSLPPIETGVRITKPTCVDIPPSLGLCYNIGYTTMRMPNLLDHDSLFEVRYQARSWIPLLLHRCHTDTQLFLCSLFAPVCLDRPIYPCRSLCESVRDGCEPLMRQNCFEWPEMLECNKFPEDNDLCIKSEMLASSNSTASEFQLEGGKYNIRSVDFMHDKAVLFDVSILISVFIYQIKYLLGTMWSSDDACVERAYSNTRSGKTADRKWFTYIIVLSI